MVEFMTKYGPVKFRTSGKRVRSRRAKSAGRAKSPWVKHIQKMSKAHPELTGPALFKVASKTYRK